MKIDHNTLVRYFLGQVSDAEKEQIGEWLESDENHWQEFLNERVRFDSSLIVDEEEITPVRSRPVRRIYTTLLKGAAVFLLLIGFGYMVRLQTLRQATPTQQSIYVPPGSRTSVTLPDGTQVWVNANTTLNYPSQFRGNDRSVELDGEAYFEVTPDKKKPFIVKTEKYNIEVLGTSFNVEAYAGKTTFETTLFSGKVKIYQDLPDVQPYYLEAGENAELINDALIISRRQSGSYRWTEGLIVIEDKSFEEIMRLFEKYFDLEIIIENEQVKKLGYDGKLRIADGIDHALKLLQNDFRFTYQRDEITNKLYIQ